MKRKFFIKTLVSVLLPLLFPLLILGAFSITIVQTSVKNEISKNSQISLNQIKETTELMFNELDTLSLNFYLNAALVSKFKSFLENVTMNYQDVEALQTFLDLISPATNSKPYIQSVYVYYDNSHGNFLVYNSGIENSASYMDRQWLDSFKNSGDKPGTWIEKRQIKQYTFERAGTDVISIYKKLYSSGSQRADGVIVMNIKQAYVESLLKTYAAYSNQAILLLDAGNTILASDCGVAGMIQDIDIGAINGREEDFFHYKSPHNVYAIMQVPSNRYDLDYITIILNSELYSLSIKLVWATILFLFISFFLSLCLAYYITQKNCNNLMGIISAFESAERGDPLPELPTKKMDEYGYIQQNIIKTFIEKSYLKVQLSEKKYRLRTMELFALQSQINPHFLFNTLKTIFWKSVALTNSQNDVSRMVENLTQILQYSILSPDKEITLEEEITNTRCYIEIQKSRYKEKLDVYWQYNDEVLACPVMRLLFQPFLENSIYHGIKEKEGKSFIKIKIRLKNSRLCISIIDNGLGMDKEALKTIRIKMNAEEERPEHIGLYNTNKRLKLMYGEQYGIKLNSKAGMGTVVHIIMPVVCGDVPQP